MNLNTKLPRGTNPKNVEGPLNTALMLVLLLLTVTAAILLPASKPAEAVTNAETIALSRNPDIIKPFRYGSYSNPEPGINQIRIDSPDRDGGAVAGSWSLDQIDFSTANLVKLDFDLLTNVTSPGDFGPRIGALVALSTSYATCCPSDRSGIFQKNAEVASVQLDCCFLPARLIFDSTRWVNPEAPNSGDRIAKVCQEVFSGYANDATWHSYQITMNLTSHTTTWMVDGAMKTSTCPSFSFVPTHVVFWAQGHDIGDSAIAQLRNPRITVSSTEISGTPTRPSDSSFSQWWFWAIAGLSATSGVLLFTNVKSRSQSKTAGNAGGQDKGSACPQCGGQMPQNSVFCGKCGHKLL